MKILKKLNLVLVALLAVTAAVPKIMQMPHEVAFFRSVGLDGTAAVVVGVAQLGAGLLLVFRKTRLWGAIGAMVIFAVSAAMLFVAGSGAVGFVSLVPVVMAGILVREHLRPV